MTHVASPMWTAATVVPMPSIKRKEVTEAAKKRALYAFGKMTKFLRHNDEKQFINCEAFKDIKPTMELMAVTAGESGSILPTTHSTLRKNGRGVMPRFTWKDPGNGTNSFAFVVEDLDARLPSRMHHGLYYNIPPDRLMIDHRDVRNHSGRNLSRLTSSSISYISTRNGNEPYIIPAPVLGHGVHRYQFTIVALSDLFIGFDRPYQVTIRELQEEIKHSVIAYGQWVGKYQYSLPSCHLVFKLISTFAF